MISLFFDDRVKRWRRLNGQFHRPPEIIRTTTRKFTPLGKIRQIIVDFYWDPRVGRYRSVKTGHFVTPKKEQLITERKAARPSRRGKTNRWKVVIGAGIATKPRRKRGTWIEWDVVARFQLPEDVIAYLTKKSAIFREVMETGADPKVALIGAEKGGERYVARKVRRTYRTVSKELEKG